MKKSSLRKIIQKETKSILENSFGRFEWGYFYLKNGRLVDEDGNEVNPKLPDFKSIEDAEKYLEKESMRGTVVGKFEESKTIKESDLRKMIRDVFMGMKNNDYDKIYRNTNYGESLIKFVKSKIPNANENDIMLADEAWKNSYLRKRLNVDQLKIYKLLKDFNRSLHTPKSTEWQKNMGLIENKIRSIIRKELKLLKEEQMVTLRSINKNNKKTYTGIMEENVNTMSIKTILDKNNIPYQKIKKDSNNEFVIVSGFKGLKYGPKWSEYEDKIYSSLEQAGWKGEKDKTSIYID